MFWSVEEEGAQALRLREGGRLERCIGYTIIVVLGLYYKKSQHFLTQKVTLDNHNDQLLLSKLPKHSK